MIRVRPMVTKPEKRVSRVKKANSIDQENIKPVSFNTRGYFDPTNCSDEHYLNEKQRVFEKYRQGHNQIVMLDIKDTNKSMLIQRGLVKPIVGELDFSGEKTKSLLKAYLQRKQRHANYQQEKFMEVPKLAIDTISLRNHTASSRTSNSRQITSRISTSTVVKIQCDF